MGERNTVLVTGCSSGFGLLSALKFAREGWHVAATMRDTTRADDLLASAAKERLDGISVAELDVTSDDSVRQGVADAFRREGRIDVLVNNAGRGYFAFLEQTDFVAARTVFETNVLGLVRVTQAVLPIMRNQGGGRIVNLSSVAGEFAYPRNGVYSASKHAVEAISESLFYEVRGQGIGVVVVQPGLFVTGFADRAAQGDTDTGLDGAYLPVLETVRERRAKLVEASEDPVSVAEVIFRAATDASPQFRYRVGPDALSQLARRRRMTDEKWMEDVMRMRDVVREQGE